MGVGYNGEAKKSRVSVESHCGGKRMLKTHKNGVLEIIQEFEFDPIGNKKKRPSAMQGANNFVVFNLRELIWLE